MRKTRSARLAILAVASLMLTGCSVPADPQGTLEHASGNSLRIGVTQEPGLVEGENGYLAGALVSIAEGYSESIDAEPEWSVRSEESLVGMLERSEIDVAFGGFTDQTPWSDRAGVSRVFEKLPGAEGRRVVVLVPMGENAFLSDIERYLDAQSSQSSQSTRTSNEKAGQP